MLILVIIEYYVVVPFVQFVVMMMIHGYGGDDEFGI